MAKESPVATPELLNAIRDDASDNYRERVPVATRSNLIDVGNPILEYEATGNEFVNALVNKVVYQLIDRRMWENPLSSLRRREMPLGFDVEEVHTNPAEAEAYDGTETGMADILKMHKPDIATAYYRLNRQDKYPVTINNDELRGAFTSWNKMESLIAQIVDSLYTGNTIDEYKLTKSLVSMAIAGNKIITQNVAPVTNEASGKAFMKVLRSLSMLFTFPSVNYNPYLLYNPTGNARTTWTPTKDQIILIRADVASAVGVEVLSTLFNLNYGDYTAQQIVVDNFNDETSLAVLTDRRAFVIMEQLRQFRTFYNGSALNWQYYYHAWDLFSLSPFHNMVVLKTQ